MVTMTRGIGMSRSVRSTVPPSRRVRAETRESLMPTTMGPMIFSSVHTAATAMAPAPM